MTGKIVKEIREINRYIKTLFFFALLLNCLIIANLIYFRSFGAFLLFIVLGFYGYIEQRHVRQRFIYLLKVAYEKNRTRTRN